jgi:hypothetical protein
MWAAHDIRAWFAPVITRVERYAGHCPCCHGVTLAAVPEGMEEDTPFRRRGDGPNRISVPTVRIVRSARDEHYHDLPGHPSASLYRGRQKLLPPLL